MGTRERPDASLLAVLLAGIAATGIGLGLWIGSPSRSEVAWWVVAAVVFLGIAYAVWNTRCRRNWEDFCGVAAIVLSVAVVLVLAWSVHRPFTDWLWLQVVVLVAATVGTLVLIAAQWSRIGLFAAAIVLGVLLVALVIRVGHRAEQLEAAAPLGEIATELDVLAAKADAGAAAANTKASADFADALTALSNSLVNAPDEFRELGGEVLAQLSSATRDPASIDAAMVALLRAGVDDARITQSLAVRDAATAAVAAVPGKPKAAPSRAAVDEALARAKCARDRSACRGDLQGEPPTLSEALHEVQVQMAAYRSAVAPGDEALEAAAAAIALQRADPLEISIWEAASAGPPAIIKSIRNHDSVALVPGPVGWALLGLIGLLILRALMRVNAAQMPGPVSIVSGAKSELDGVLRVALLKNLKTPAAAPGSAVAQSITDISALAGAEAGVIGKAFAAISNTLSPAPGYSVEVDVVEPEKEEADTTAKATAARRTRVLARVSSASTKESIGSAVFERDSARQAMQSAGLWAAGFLLNRSTRVPSWATWNEGTAEALDAANAEDPTLADLQQAAKTAPASGWILVLYGNGLELADRRLDAVGVYARAVAAHPRYLIARYRLAVALAMSGHSSAKAWTSASLAARAAALGSVRRAAARLDVDESLVAGVQTAPTQTTLFALARRLLETIEEDSSGVLPWAGSLRRSERSMDWLGWWHGGRTSNSAIKWLAKSAQLVYGDAAKLADVTDHAKRPDSSWQISYNLACYYASTAPSLALDALERCLVRPGVEQLTAEWVQRDPDLKAISSSPRFAAFCAQLDQGGTA